MTISYFKELANYNIWANNIQISWLETITEEQWSQPVTSSFGSIGATVLHIAGGEHIWYERIINKEKPVWLPKVFVGSKRETIDLWKTCSLELKSCTDDFDPDSLQSILSFIRLNGEENQMSYQHVFAHVFNHSTYHRGQILLMLRQVGFDQVGSTDMLGYFRIK